MEKDLKVIVMMETQFQVTDAIKIVKLKLDGHASVVPRHQGMYVH
jgi:hypothetical protein